MTLEKKLKLLINYAKHNFPSLNNLYFGAQTCAQ
jgi:hypothetical protein